MKKIGPSNRRKMMTLTLVGVFILVAVFALYKYGAKKDADVASTEGGGYINYNPPTEEEKLAGNKAKFSNDDPNNSQSNADIASNESVSVIITDAGQYDNVIEVRSFIPNHYEDGTCTITFTQGSLKIAKDTPAYKDVATTICTNPEFDRSEFPNSGEWQVVVEYKSAGANGRSSPQNLTIN